MRNTALFIFCTTAFSCGEPQDPVSTPVDMEYNVSVELLEEGCTENPLPSDLSVTLNITLQTDGSMTVAYPTGFVPGSGNLEGLVVTDGKAVLSMLDNPDLNVTGTLPMDSADIVFEGQRLILQDTGLETLCAGNTKVHLNGTARPFWEGSVLDGKYEAHYDFYGIICPPGVPGEDEPNSWTVPLDIKNHNGSAFFAFDSHDEILLFEMPTSSLETGSVDWSGKMYLIGRVYGYFYEFDGTAVGDFTNGSYSLRLSFHEASTPQCDFVLDASGAKRLPDMANVSNVYRLAFLKSDQCAPDGNGNPTTEVFELEADVALRKDSKLSMMHGVQRFDLEEQSAGTYGGHWGNSTMTLDYSVTITPPELSLSYSWGYETTDGLCYETYTAVGVPRYFPELELNTPKIADEKRRLTKWSEPRELGLTARLKDSARLRPLSEAPQFVQQAIFAR